MPYYPEQRFVSSWARIQREALLPEDAIGRVRAEVGQRVDIRDKVARGLIPSRHVIIEAAQALRLRRPEQLEELMLVEINTRVRKDDVLAGKNPERGRRVFAPVGGLVVFVGEGRIIMQENPQIIDLEAGVRGRITNVYPGRGVSIQATGAVVQGVWGNGKTALATLRLEPDGGIEAMSRDSLEQTYRNEVVVTNKPLSNEMLAVAAIRKFAGLIAPSMEASFLTTALEADYAILLTGGFGSTNMTSAVYNVLQQFEGNQCTLDAYQPLRWEPRRPEVVINRPPAGARDERSNDVALREGLQVRITRAPYAGLTGTVVDLPTTPVLLENSLRVRCARIELLPGEFVDVPLANLELAGT